MTVTVATRRVSFARRPAPRDRAWRERCLHACCLALAVIAPAMLAASPPSLAQSSTYNPLPPQPDAAARPAARTTGRCCVQAQEVNYDNVN